jgi:deoxyadenosine/deoxycytidine kinase
MMAFHTRQNIIQEAIANADYNVETIVMERSLDADYRIFANMLHEQGCMEDLEYQIYCYSSQEGLKKYGVSSIIWLQVDPEECYRRILSRNRKGESDISIDYLHKCEEFHKEWLGADLGFSCDIDGVNPDADLEKIEKYLDLV